MALLVVGASVPVGVAQAVEGPKPPMTKTDAVQTITNCWSTVHHLSIVPHPCPKPTWLRFVNHTAKGQPVVGYERYSYGGPCTQVDRETITCHARTDVRFPRSSAWSNYPHVLHPPRWHTSYDFTVTWQTWNEPAHLWLPGFVNITEPRDEGPFPVPADGWSD